MNKLKLILLSLLCLATFTVSSQQVKVLAVHDGDSYKIKWPDGTVEWGRLWGVDCPEVISNRIEKNQPFGVQTGNFVRYWLKGQTVTIDTTVKQTDPYERLLFKVVVDSALYSRLDTVKGEFVTDLSTYLVLNGYAWWVDKSLQDEMELAKQSKIGLWGLSGRKVRPDTWRKRNWKD